MSGIMDLFRRKEPDVPGRVEIIPTVYEINVKGKYVLTVPAGASSEETHRLVDGVQKWLAGDDPILMVSDRVKLVRVVEA